MSTDDSHQRPTPGPATSAGDRPTGLPPAETVWPCLAYVDAPGIIEQLVGVFGFEARLVVRDEHRPEVIVHSQLTWPEGGGVMLGTADRPDSDSSRQGTGCASLYVVTDRVRELAAAAAAAPGWRLIGELDTPDYGGESFSVRDPEGNLWSFGSYRGEPG